MRARLVEAAIELLDAEGPAAVQARRLAREIGASTMAVYHYFGGMPALLRAVCDEGFRRLEAHLAAVAITEDPITDIVRLGAAYRRAARENPHLYDMMFGLAAPGGHRPEPAPHDDGGGRPGPGDAAYGHLVAAAHRAVQAGSIRPAEPALIAAQLWSMLHGFVALELAGHFRQLPEAADQVLAPLGTNLLIGLGGEPDHVLATAAQAPIE
ncbi:DNA-binding transcriptional regulator, AcrR family [Amycolatopsis arida]|uniref:DNA-binding transcriptional regulator, AcrR family n=2 Tax=Amycolatopsis arida TaxID=587909 RepID=A0A1I6ANG6_9PSEU|nr:AcrR family transcriptional regulator [Amycolatopsis arida]SFQ70186.1 DNA-binding transcriptional regulator, AcrR family [Amycolatopsis arida]